MNESLNQALRRDIKNGNEFNSLIPKSSCTAQNLGNGSNNTIEGVEFMAQWVKENDHQVVKLAEKLKKRSLSETVASIFNFLYHHFQYNADDTLQNLRSPACSWAKRREGIDCKSYTIFAVALCRRMGLSSYIRQIKQPGHFEDEFTHVYAIVPINQKNVKDTDFFQGEYYVIDATVSDNEEPLFIEAKDKLMQGLPYRGLKGGCSPKQAKKVVKASNAGSRLQQGKSTGGRDLAKWRWGLLGVASQISETKESRNFQKSFRHFINAGFSLKQLDLMKNYMKFLQNKRKTFEDIFFIPKINGIQITNNIDESLLFEPQNKTLWANIYQQQTKTQSRGLGLPIVPVVGGVSQIPGIKDIFGGVLGGIGDFFGGIFGGIFGGGGWYKAEFIEREFNKLVELLGKHQKNINQAVQNNNMNALSNSIAEMKLEYKLFLKSAKYQRTRPDKNWGGNTGSNLDKMIKAIEAVVNKTEPSLNTWINTYFRQVGTQGQKSKDSSFYKTIYNDSPFQYPVKQVVNQPIIKYQIKNGIREIRAFVFGDQGPVIWTNTVFEPSNPNNTNNIQPQTSNASLFVFGAIALGFIFKNQFIKKTNTNLKK